MKVKCKIDGVAKTQNVLRALLTSAEKDKKTAAVVGYWKHYAVYVHENLNSYHPVGQAKYLEGPARVFRTEIARAGITAFKRSKSLVKGLYASGLYLQRLSQKVVPVDTGALRASAFTAIEEYGYYVVDPFLKNLSKQHKLKKPVKKKRKKRK